jgi:hypothetical protein
MAKIGDISVICRSKNAGPFLITLDVVFANQEVYEKVKASGVINPGLIAKLYSVPLDQVLFTEYDRAFAFKATIPRLVSSGDLEDCDVYGAQQHAPLFDVEIPGT